MAEAFVDRLAERIHRLGTRISVGLDPVLADLPAPLLSRASRGPDETAFGEALVAWGRALLEATADLAACVKPQVAYFERFGAPGWAALAELVGYARELGIPVVLDAKRSDIGSTAAAYAAALVGADGLDADAVTLSPYLGEDAVAPFLAEPGKGVFVLAVTSNPSAAALQDLMLSDGRKVWEAVVDLVTGWAEREPAGPYHRLGLVAGATRPGELAAVRARAPRSWLLVPGVGAQGASMADVLPAFDREGLGAIVNLSRGITRAGAGAPDLDAWAGRCRQACRSARDELEAGLRSRCPNRRISTSPGAAQA